MNRERYMESKKAFARMREEAKGREDVLEAARNGATYMEIYEMLRFPGAPDIRQEDSAQVIARIYPPAAKIKRAQRKEAMKAKKALAHQAVWLSLQGIVAEKAAKILKVRGSYVRKMLYELYHLGDEKVVCLRCGKKFFSWNKRYNRICPRCKAINRELYYESHASYTEEVVI